MPEILMVCDRSEEAGPVLEYELAEAFKKKGESAQIMTSGNEENAKSLLPTGHFSLVITFLQIRKQPMAKMSQEDEEGLELVRWMNRENINTPSILITPTYTKKLQSVQGELRDCYPLVSGKDMVQDVVKQALTMVKKPLEKCLEVEIEVSSRTEWSYRLIGKGFGFEKSDKLSIDERTVRRLLNESKTMRDAGNWHDMLRQIGDDLLEVLCRDKRFALALSQGITKADGEINTKVRFLVKPDLHGLALEAVLCPNESDRFWMLRAPVYRRLWTPAASTGGCLFEGGQRIDCLIINAPTFGMVNVDDREIRLSKIESVSAECDWLEDFLNQKRNEFNIGAVQHLTKEGEPALARRVKDNLESHDWTIVHYAGHSYYDARTDKGLVFFPGSEGTGVEKMELKRFSDCLRQPTFVYFSSCESGEDPFVFGLVNRQVPNILGFRWNIKDSFALEYAKNFYETLFKARSLEKAFLEARKQMYERHEEDRIWAAPILVKQLSES